SRDCCERRRTAGTGNEGRVVQGPPCFDVERPDPRSPRPSPQRRGRTAVHTLRILQRQKHQALEIIPRLPWGEGRGGKKRTATAGVVGEMPAPWTVVAGQKLLFLR